MLRTSAPLTAGSHRVMVDFIVRPGITWDVRISVNGEEVMVLQHLLQLTGMAPFAGISIGLDRGGPVDCELSLRHGRFHYTGTLHREMARIYE